MAKAVRREAVPALVIGLNSPGMTPLLRAGLGGLAASLRAVLRTTHPKAKWPASVPLADGLAVVEPHRITLSWDSGRPANVLKELFGASFRLSKPYGLIDLPGTYDHRVPTPAVAASLQGAMKKTFLQHGSTTTKKGEPVTVSLTVDDRVLPVTMQAYSDFRHQTAWSVIDDAFSSGAAELAGWAYPGAAQRHIGFAETKCSYTPAQAVCACFALIGCISYTTPGGGALVIPEPSDLVQFAAIRPLLTPRRLSDAYVAGTADAVLAVHLALRMDTASRDRTGIANAHGVTLRTTPWAKQQKSRVSTLTPGVITERILDLYDTAARELPTTIRITGKSASEDDDESGFFSATSALRGFIAENLASGEPWFKGFTTATVGGKKPRFIHYYRAKDNRGALFFNERKGLIRMLSYLDDAEQVLVTSVHIALRQRFGAIASETEGNPATMQNRFQSEREKWRLAFSSAKTPEQIRGSLADLWSRAGSNSELQSRWKDVLPLLRQSHWQVARDLALVALASYRGGGEQDIEGAS